MIAPAFPILRLVRLLLVFVAILRLVRLLRIFRLLAPSLPFPSPRFPPSSRHSQNTRIRAACREESPDTTGQDSRRKPGRGESRDGKCHREQTARTREGEGKGETVG